MKIKLANIKPSPLAIRTTWDEEGLENLANSIKEHGLVVPIKVRPINKGKYEIVYGHRRVKAMRRAGMKETEAVVQGVDDTQLLVEALIENVQREDMTPIDVARALFAIQEETGWSQMEMARRGIMPVQSISRTMGLLRESPKVQDMISKGEVGGEAGGTHVNLGKVTPFHIEVARAVGLADNTRDKVLRKAAQEGLTAAQTRRVAESIKSAPDQQAVDKLIEWNFNPAVHDPERVKARARIYGKDDPMYAVKAMGVEGWRHSSEVRSLIDNIRNIQENDLPAWKKTAENIPRDSAKFLASLVRTFLNDLVYWVEELED